MEADLANIAQTMINFLNENIAPGRQPDYGADKRNTFVSIIVEFPHQHVSYDVVSTPIYPRNELEVAIINSINAMFDENNPIVLLANELKNQLENYKNDVLSGKPSEQAFTNQLNISMQNIVAVYNVASENMMHGGKRKYKKYRKSHKKSRKSHKKSRKSHKKSRKH